MSAAPGIQNQESADWMSSRGHCLLPHVSSRLCSSVQATQRRAELYRLTLLHDGVLHGIYSGSLGPPQASLCQRSTHIVFSLCSATRHAPIYRTLHCWQRHMEQDRHIKKTNKKDKQNRQTKYTNKIDKQNRKSTR